MAVEYHCPVHRDLLTRADDGSYIGTVHGLRYPVVDGIPILLPDENDRRQITDVNWSSEASGPANAINFYNQSRDQDCYCRERLDDVRTNIERVLGDVRTDGPVLEIGSGKGALQGLGGEDYVALDYGFTALRKYVDPKYQRVCGDAASLPFPDGAFRLVFTVAALEHVPAADRAFGEIDRVLKPGGIAYLLPAWHCVQYNCEGIPVRRYGELTLRQRLIKLSLPWRQTRAAKALGSLPARVARRAWWSVSRGPARFRFGKLRPDYQTFWMSDSDAAARLDAHEGCLFFHSRGYEVLKPGGTALRQLLARHEPVVVRKAATTVRRRA